MKSNVEVLGMGNIKRKNIVGKCLWKFPLIKKISYGVGFSKGSNNFIFRNPWNLLQGYPTFEFEVA